MLWLVLKTLLALALVVYLFHVHLQLTGRGARAAQAFTRFCIAFLLACLLISWLPP